MKYLSLVIVLSIILIQTACSDEPPPQPPAMPVQALQPPAPSQPVPAQATSTAPVTSAGQPTNVRFPVVCGAADQVIISGQTVSLPGEIAISAAGACHATIIDSNITAQEAINASGTAQVIVQGGRIEGRRSIVAAGQANVTVVNAQVIGPVHRVGEATINGVQ